MSSASDESRSGLPSGQSEEAASQELPSRRESLKQIGRFAAATAPAMLVLLEHGSASACDDDEGGSQTRPSKFGKRKSFD